MTTDELERVAYITGDIHTANLLARIDDLCQALGKATADNEELQQENDTLQCKCDDLESDVFNLKALQQENDTLQQENDILRSELKAAQFDRAYGGSID